MLRRLFLDHPEAVGESYLEHAKAAGTFGLTMIVAGSACVVHAILPAFFRTTASDAVKQLHSRMSNRVPRTERVQAARPISSPWQLEYEI